MIRALPPRDAAAALRQVRRIAPPHDRELRLINRAGTGILSLRLVRFWPI